MRYSLILMLVGVCVFAGAEEAQPLEYFSEGGVPNEYHFDTGMLSGTFGFSGLALGLYPLQVKEDGTEITVSIGLLNYYRIFTTNHRYGESLRAQPHETRLEGPDTVRVWWPAVEDRPFAVTAVYRWVAPDTLDLETIVEAKATLPDFDVFLASYLGPEFPVASAYAKASDGGAPAFITAEQDEGTWHVFPRDKAALALIHDGRWTIEPSPVDWAVRPEFAVPIIYRRQETSGWTAAIMTPPDECFALFSSCRGETHYSMYLSLFGRTLQEGETARSTVRLVIGKLDDEALLKRYEEFIKER